jgi:hypothetical protein
MIKGQERSADEVLVDREELHFGFDIKYTVIYPERLPRVSAIVYVLLFVLPDI